MILTKFRGRQAVQHPHRIEKYSPCVRAVFFSALWERAEIIVPLVALAPPRPEYVCCRSFVVDVRCLEALLRRGED